MSLTFADLGVSAAVRGALAERGFHEPFAIQKLVIADVLAGHDVLAQSPTGSGKTLAFGVPIADRIEATDRRPSALILAPTRELAAQIVEETREVAHARALSIAAVYGGVGYEKQTRVARKAHILVATPGRLEDLLQRRALSLAHIKVLVLDEADRMLDMGFKPAVDRIVAQCPRDRQTLFFSATLTGEAGRAAARYTHDARRHEHRHPQDATTAIEHRFVAVEHERKLDALVAELDGRSVRTLVFVRTKRGADRLTKRLSAHGIEAVAMHGNKSQAQREKALARFEAGGVATLVATDVAARGIDVDGISHVINFDPPDDHDAYTHRVGRTGRAGRTGVGITFVGVDEAHDVSRMAAALDLHREFAGSGLRPAPSSPSRGGSRPPSRRANGRPQGQGKGRPGRRQRVR